MFGVGSGEIILIMVIAMLVVGPERMVEFARTAGELLAKFRNETDSVTSEFKEALDLQPLQEAMTSAKEAVSEVSDSLKSTRDIAQGEMASAHEAVAEAAQAAQDDPATTIAPRASAFADSQVTRVTSQLVGVETIPDAATTLAMPEDEDADSMHDETGEGQEADVYEVTLLDGPEVMDGSDDEVVNSVLPSEG